MNGLGGLDGLDIGEYNLGFGVLGLDLSGLKLVVWGHIHHAHWSVWHRVRALNCG